MERINKNPGISKVIAVRVLVFGFVLLSAGGELRAQQMSDLPSKPTPAVGEQNISVPVVSSDNADVISAGPLTFGERLKIYEHSFTNPESLVGPVLGAGIGQLRDTPPEWGSGADGFGLRLASGFGRSVISRTISFGVASVDGEDSRFTPSHESGIWKRTRHAVVGTFVSRTASGGTMPAISRFTGVYSAAFIANAWEPPSQDSYGHALERGSTALLSIVGWHVFEEFWPDIRGTLRHKHN